MTNTNTTKLTNDQNPKFWVLECGHWKLELEIGFLMSIETF